MERPSEKEAAQILKLSGHTTNDAPDAWDVVANVLGEEAMRMVPRAQIFGASGSLTRRSGKTLILVADDLSPVQVSFCLLHELAHFCCGYPWQGSREVEAYCDAVAAAVACPADSFLDAARSVGPNWGELAGAFGVDETCAALRYAELDGTPTCVVSDRAIRIRGRAFGWPPEDAQIRRLSMLPACPGMRRQVLHGVGHRVLLTAET